AEYGVRYYPLRLYEHSLACVLAVTDFIGAIRDGRTPLCSVDESAATVLACLAGVESYRTNRRSRFARCTTWLSHPRLPRDDRLERPAAVRPGASDARGGRRRCAG